MLTSPDSEDTGRFRRRITTVPTVLAVAALGLLSAPFAVHLIALADLARGRLQLPGLRVWAMAMQYLFNETVEVLAAPLLWIAAGLGTRLDSPSSRRRHTRLALWSARSLARRAEQLLGVHLVVHEDRQRLPVNASTLVLARHASVLDAALPAVVLFDSNRVQDHTLTGVLMSELLSDPGFDLIYHRLGCVFVDRADGPDARRRIRAMAESLGDASVAVVFPEGRLFSRASLERRMQTLSERDPERARRLESLDSVLPPHPGGVLEALDGTDGAHVAVVAHRGLESVASLRELCRTAPVRHPVEVRVTWWEPEAIPASRADRVEWLDEVYLDMDRWVRRCDDGGALAGPEPVGAVDGAVDGVESGVVAGRPLQV